jgi:hypothetical protein
VAGLEVVASMEAASVGDAREVVTTKSCSGGICRMLLLTGCYKNSAARLCMLALLVILPMSVVSCNKSDHANAPKAAQITFGSPAEAGAALIQAAKSEDQTALLEIFGPESKEVLFSGDAVEDKNHLQEFIAAYDQMNRWSKLKAGGQFLYIGADNYAFPIPLDQNSAGRWYFDTAAGKDEILARRVGKGELAAIAVLNNLVDGERDYFNQTHDGDKTKQYAQKFISDDGKQNGLYWPVSQGETASPLGALAEFAKSLDYTNSSGKPQPFNGYYFQILDKQGDKANGGTKDYVVDGKMTRGFAILAYPAVYRNSGIMTFIVDQDGVIYEKDLGDKTQDVAVAMAEYNPGDGWARVAEEEPQYVAKKR